MLCIKIIEKDKYFKDLIDLIKKIASKCNSSTKITQEMIQVCGTKVTFDITENRWIQLVHIKKCFEPFNQYTEMSCKEAKTIVYETKMIIEEFKRHLNEYTNDSISNVANEILNEIDKQFAFIYDQTK